MHRETIPDPVWRVLLGLSSLGSMRSGYLAGGSGLAVQLGHRVSVDLDFFFTQGSDHLDVLEELPPLQMSAIVMGQTTGHCVLMIDGVKVDFIRERIPLKHPPITLALGDATVKVADPVDIGRLKLFSIASRGSRKDFIDLYCLTREVMPLGDLLVEVMEDQKGIRFNRLLFLKGLVDFEEADREVSPVLLWDISWERVKEDLTRQVKGLVEGWGDG